MRVLRIATRNAITILICFITVKDSADMIVSLDPFGPPLIADMVSGCSVVAN